MMSGHKKILSTKILTGLIALLTASLLSACGGAAGNVTSKANSITYSGLTTQATLTSDNDDAFGLAMLEGGAESGKALDQIPFATSTSNAESESITKNQLSAIQTMVREIIANTQQQLSTDQDSTAASINMLGQVYATGNCGGTIDVSSSQSGGSITFNNYCSTVTFGDQTIKTTMNGSVSFSLTGDTTSGTYEIVYRYSSMTITIDDGTDTTSHSFSGTITYSVENYTTFTITYSTSFKREGKTYQLENPTISDSSTTIYVSGRLYHPDYGYVEITTSSPFSKLGSQYCGGTLLIETKNSDGSTINSSTMTVNDDCTSYTISFDGGDLWSLHGLK